MEKNGFAGDGFARDEVERRCGEGKKMGCSLRFQKEKK